METDAYFLGTETPEAGANRPVPCSSCDEDVFDRSELMSDTPEKV